MICRVSSHLTFFRNHGTAAVDDGREARLKWDREDLWALVAGGAHRKNYVDHRRVFLVVVLNDTWQILRRKMMVMRR
jgi:hypothetical protein